MFVKLSRKKALPLTNREANRIEQHTLTLSLYAVIIVAVGSLLMVCILVLKQLF